VGHGFGGSIDLLLIRRQISRILADGIFDGFGDDASSGLKGLGCKLGETFSGRP